MAAPAPRYNLIVVGSGIAGLFVALEAHRAGLGPVLVLTKGSIDDCNTRWAQGGIAAAIGPQDSPEQHFQDTVAAGAGLVDEVAAWILCSEAPRRVRDLIEYGVSFDSLGGEVVLGREAAHSRDRILHAGGDRTGAEIERALSAAVRQPGITVLDFTAVTRLLVGDDGAEGVEAVHAEGGQTERFLAPYVVIATGGAGQLYAHTTNPDVATGDGLALGFLAGAEVMDVEFVQFHPTAFAAPGAPPFLISEAVRGEGAVLRNRRGEAFMTRYDERAELAPRDVVARAIVAEMRRDDAECVYLDCRSLNGVDPAARFPGVYAFCRSQGIDLRRDLVPVAPAAHYFMGGLRTDTWARTTVPGLYAVGEAACTGVHGANRLASNSLVETIVFGKRCVESIATGERAAAPPHPEAIPFSPARRLPPDKRTLQRLMWDAAGIEREERGLASALETLRQWPHDDDHAAPDRDLLERRALALVAELVLEAALRRTESRGAHFRRDYPEPDDIRWKRHQVFHYVD
ncbi:L-aspartate oxidase [bacterium HR29]|jgi:L-aspartate oxidase|nr:L-aspartate oxidase [bacterium HR29]